MTWFTKNQWITVAGLVAGSIITIFATIIIPLWFERAIIEYNFEETKYPSSNEMIFDGANYFVEIWAGNSGKSNGVVIFTVSSENVEISLDRTSWTRYYQGEWLVNPGSRHELVTIYIKPGDTDQFSVELTAANAKKMSPFQELFPLSPTKITYEKLNEKYLLITK